MSSETLVLGQYSKLKVIPAEAAGVSSNPPGIGDIVALVEAGEARSGWTRGPYQKGVKK